MSTVLDGPTAPRGRATVLHPAEVARQPLAQDEPGVAPDGPDAGPEPALDTARDQAVLPPDEWLPLATAHAERADALTAVWRAARAEGRKHAIEDFLFTYYPTRIAHLRRWHPGAGVALLLPGTGVTRPADGESSNGSGANNGAPDPDDRTTWRWHRTTRLDGATHDGATHDGANYDGATHGAAHNGAAQDVVDLDAAAFLADRGDTVRYVRDLLAATSSRPGTFGCFGLHEWAMVHRADATRHEIPLRLGAAATDRVTEDHRIACSHFDAFRFFRPSAVGFNTLSPGPGDRPAYEQPACLHGGMDLYKHAYRLSPMICSDLVADAFELAWEIRILDMRAAPYDMSGWTLDPTGEPWRPVCIETPEGKAEYVAAQRAFAERGAPIRAALIAECERLLGMGDRVANPAGTLGQR